MASFRFAIVGLIFVILAPQLLVPARVVADTTTGLRLRIVSDTVVQVVIQNFKYKPAEITIKQGTTVAWTNQDPVGHTVTQVSHRAGHGGFDSGLIGQGGSWSFTFTEPGVYEYYCIPHPWMKGEITVVSASS